MQSLTAPRTVGYVLSVALAIFIIVEEQPLVLIPLWLPPEFSPDPLFLLALAIIDSHEIPMPFSISSSQKYSLGHIMSHLRHNQISQSM